MNTKKIISGTAVWSVGILIPTLHHALLMLAAVQEEGYAYSYSNMVKYFMKMPWPLAVFMVAMAITGAILVISGLKASGVNEKERT